MSCLNTERSSKDDTEQSQGDEGTATGEASNLISIPASEMHSVNVEEEVSTPKGNSKMLSLYKERLRKSKERNAKLRKRLFEERGEKRKLLKVLVYTYACKFYG